MATMTYKEQLLHPNWQRKRLEMLSAADFKCQSCLNGEVTLHVHHKRYVKGRMAWEYENIELEVLCEVCHADQHEVHALLEEVLAYTDHFDSYRTALGLVAGYLEAGYSIPSELAARARAQTGVGFDVGIAAYAIALSSRKDASAALTELNKGSVNGPVLDDLLDRWAKTISSLDKEDGGAVG